MSYEVLVDKGARAYVQHLRSLSTHSTKKVVGSLVDTIEAALSDKSKLSLGKVTFARNVLNGVPEDGLAQFINQWGLGFGTPTAPAIFMGTEQAFDVSSTAPAEKGLINFTLDCGLPALSLCGGTETVVEALTSGHWKACGRREYTAHPNDYYRADARRGQHTWKCISKVLAGRENNWKVLLDPKCCPAALLRGYAAG